MINKTILARHKMFQNQSIYRGGGTTVHNNIISNKDSFHANSILILCAQNQITIELVINNKN